MQRRHFTAPNSQIALRKKILTYANTQVTRNNEFSVLASVRTYRSAQHRMHLQRKAQQLHRVYIVEIIYFIVWVVGLVEGVDGVRVRV